MHGPTNVTPVTCVGFVRIIDDYQTFLLFANRYRYFLRLSANRREITCCVALRHVGTGKALRVCLVAEPRETSV